MYLLIVMVTETQKVDAFFKIQKISFSEPAYWSPFCHIPEKESKHLPERLHCVPRIVNTVRLKEEKLPTINIMCMCKSTFKVSLMIYLAEENVPLRHIFM